MDIFGLSTRAGKTVFGTDACLQAIEKKKLKLVLIAEDASERTKQNFIKKCKDNLIPVFVFGKAEELSKWVGKMNKVVIGIKEKNLAKEIIEIFDGGDING